MKNYSAKMVIMHDWWRWICKTTILQDSVVSVLQIKMYCLRELQAGVLFPGFKVS